MAVHLLPTESAAVLRAPVLKESAFGLRESSATQTDKQQATLAQAEVKLSRVLSSECRISDFTSAGRGSAIFITKFNMSLRNVL